MSRVPETAVTRTILDLVATVPVYDSGRLSERLGRLLARFHAEEAQDFPEAYGLILPLLASDLDRAAMAANTAVELDLHEAVPGLMGLARTLPEPGILLSLASLAAHPSVSRTDRGAALSLIESASLDDSVRRAIAIRMSAEAVPADDYEQLLYAQSWPGSSRSGQRRLAPTVLLDEADANAHDVWTLVAALAVRGAAVRRVPIHTGGHIEQRWMPGGGPLVAWSSAAVGRLRTNGVDIDASRLVIPDVPLTPLAVERVINRLNSLLPPQQRLRQRQQADLGPQPAPLAPETLVMGAYDVYDMAFLGSARRSSVYDAAKKGLEPLRADVQRWSFAQLIALRTVQLFRAHARRVAPDAHTLLRNLTDLASAAETAKVGMDANGSVFVDRGDGFVHLGTGQEPLTTVVAIDDVFQPFKIGGGHVPALLQPSPETDAHPARHGGTPSVSGKRITARALAELVEVRGREVVSQVYPELDSVQVTDTLHVGRSLLHVP